MITEPILAVRRLFRKSNDTNATHAKGEHDPHPTPENGCMLEARMRREPAIGLRANMQGSGGAGVGGGDGSHCHRPLLNSIVLRQNPAGYFNSCLTSIIVLLEY